MIHIIQALRRSALEIGHFLEVQRHDAAASFQSPAKGDTIVAQGQRGAGARDRRPTERRPGSAFQPISSPLPPNHLLWGDAGGGTGEGGVPCQIVNHAFRLSFQVCGQETSISGIAPSSPLTLSLSPNTERVLGERVEICGNPDPGRPQRLLPLTAPWANVLRP